jgi:hypothetical protein
VFPINSVEEAIPHFERAIRLSPKIGDHHGTGAGGLSNCSRVTDEANMSCKSEQR